jgi:HEAT repeat protein
VPARKQSQPATDPAVVGTGPDDERRRALVAGSTGDIATALDLTGHPDPKVRAAALGSLDNADRLPLQRILDALGDGAWRVRRRACEIAGRRPAEDAPSLTAAVMSRLDDSEALVAETAAWALGEMIPRSGSSSREAVLAIGEMATGHKDPLCRESAVAALGAIGDPSSLDHVLKALEDKPPIRRRAAVALAAFDDPRADAALERCLEDRDWQVRQAAEDLRPRP